jgi:hypothetical protein
LEFLLKLIAINGCLKLNVNLKTIHMQSPFLLAIPGQMEWILIGITTGIIAGVVTIIVRARKRARD